MSGADPFIHGDRELNARLLKPMLKYYQTRFGREALEGMAQRLGTSLRVLEDEDRWFSVQNFRDISRLMAEDTGEADISYEAGKAFVEPGILGPERILARAAAGTGLLYKQMQKVTDRYSAVTDWEVSVHPGRTADIVFHTKSIELDDPMFCRNRLGLIEAVPTLFDLPPANVKHPECLHEGGSCCRYEVSWTSHSAWVRPVMWSGVLLAVAALVLWLIGSQWAGLALVVGLVMGIAGAGGAALDRAREAKRVRETANLQVSALEESLEANDRRVEQLLLIQALNEVAARHLDEETLLDAFLDRLVQDSSWDRVLLMLRDEEAGVLGDTRSRGFEPQAAERVRGLEISLAVRGDDERLFANIVARREAELIVDLPGYATGLTERNRKLLEDFGSASMLVVPFEARGEVLGLLVVDRMSGRALDGKDQDQLESVGAALGMALSNARLFTQVNDELLKNRKYSQFLPSPVVRQIQANPAAALELGGARRNMALMFCDIAGFTALSASQTPEDIVRGLNAWFGIADPVIEACNGIVDKRMGDGILVVFLEEEGPTDGRHPVERAAAAAAGMAATLEAARDQLREVVPGFAEITVRWAVHWGEVVAGNLGSQARVEYTVIGDAVNTCARLEEITPAGAAWFTGEAVRAVPGGLRAATLEATTRLRGRSEDTEVWSIPLDGSATDTGTWAATTSASISITGMDLGPPPTVAEIPTVEE